MNSLEKKEIIQSSFWVNLFKTNDHKGEFENIIISLPPFETFSSKDLDLLKPMLHVRKYLKGEIIFHQDDPGIGLYIIQDGEVKIERMYENQKYNLGSFAKGDFFGELALIDGANRSASAIATEDTNLVVLFKPDLDEFIEKYPKKGIRILQGLTQIISQRLHKLNEEVFSLLKRNNIKPEELNGTRY